MENIFITLTAAVGGVPVVALFAAFLWGILSILLSPCHLASIPLIVGFIDEQGNKGTMRAFIVSLLFATGILVTIAVIGAVTAAAGKIMGDIGGYGNYFVAIIFFAVGVQLLGIFSIFGHSPGKMGVKQKGLLAAFVLGLIFGIALGPCSFAYMAPLLGITFKLGAEQPFYATSLLFMYGVGHCSVIVFAGTSTGLVQRYLNWNEHSKGTLLLKRVCGILVILAGLYMIYVAP